MTGVWLSLRKLWQRKPSGRFTVTELLGQVVIPTLRRTASHNELGEHGRHFQECFNLITASWDSLNRPDSASGLAIPLVRLARLMSSASTALPKWLTSVERMNVLFWKANECLGLTEPNISWDFVSAALQNLPGSRYFPLLHLYTVLISQSITHHPQSGEMPKRRHEIMNLVVQRCCKKIGGDGWIGKPSNEFKDVLVAVYGQLRNYQLEQKKLSLRGHGDEEDIVKGLWALAAWGITRTK